MFNISSQSVEDIMSITLMWRISLYAGQETSTTDEWNSSEVWGALDFEAWLKFSLCKEILHI